MPKSPLDPLPFDLSHPAARCSVLGVEATMIAVESFDDICNRHGLPGA